MRHYNRKESSPIKKCAYTTPFFCYQLKLSRKNSNPQFQSQNLTCYHYTTGQFI